MYGKSKKIRRICLGLRSGVGHGRMRRQSSDGGYADGRIRNDDYIGNARGYDCFVGTVLFVGWRLKKTDIYDEFTNGGSLRTNVKIFGVLWFLIRYICPVAISLIFLLGIL